MGADATHLTACASRANAAALVLLVSCIACGCTVSGTVGVIGADSTGDADGTGSADDAERLDVASNPLACDGDESLTAQIPCSHEAPPESFEPVELWSWSGHGRDTDVFVTPLVASLTDDDGNGRVDACDVPDLVVLAGPPRTRDRLLPHEPGHLHVLDGRDGTLHLRIDHAVSPAYTPALGDVDGDGQVDIVAIRDESDPAQPDAPFVGRIVAFSHDGELLFEGSQPFAGDGFGSVSLADVEGDTVVWILVDRIAARGPTVVFELDDFVGGVVPLAVDLDLDGVQEILWGREARRADGTLYFETSLRHGHAMLGNFDDDPNPEIVLAHADGLALIDHDGTVLVEQARPLSDVPAGVSWRRPGALHDLDGDRTPELLMGVGQWFAAFRVLGSERAFAPLWAVPITDAAGAAGATAFDFLGDGRAEAMLADETTLHLLDLDGRAVLQVPRSGITLQAYPIVADVDGDGSAEIVVVSNTVEGVARAPTVRVLGEREGRWVPARRVWNQHAYHVTNVEESGHIPAQPLRGWQRLNTFRTNAQIENGVVCVPPVP